MKIKHLCAVLLLAFTASSALGATSFTEAEDQLWTNANNWSTLWLPASDETTHIGGMSGAYADVTCIIPAGSSVSSGELRVGYNVNGTLIIEEGATLTTTGHTQLGAGTDGTGLGTAVINGNLYAAGWAFSVGGNGPGDVTIGPNAVVTIDSAVNIGQTYQESGGYDTFINQTGGLLDIAGVVQLKARDGASVHYKISGGTINTGVEKKWFTLGGTFEVGGQATISASPRFYAPSDGEVILKFSGTDPLLTVDGGPNFGINALTYIDVSELTLSTADAWVPVLSAIYIMNSDYVVLDPNTGAEWSMQVSGGNIELMYAGGRIMGDVNLSGYVDDDDLSLLLANWVIGDEWGEGDLNENGIVNDDDLSLLLANWGAGSSPAPEAVPEPASALILLLGLPFLARRRMQR